MLWHQLPEARPAIRRRSPVGFFSYGPLTSPGAAVASPGEAADMVQVDASHRVFPVLAASADEGS